ncbi:MAG: hypothetical protein ABII00_02340 [Elusimicrobiota bacterium]
MMRKRSLLLYRIAAILALVLASASARPAAAQDYKFTVPRVSCDVLVEPDGSARIHYAFTFKNMPGAHAIDFVDVGMPIKDYRVIKAQVGDRVIPGGWSPSKYVEIGPEIPLGANAIAAGEEGVVRVVAEVGPGLVWQDTTDKEYAAFRFTPTWFGSRYVVGRTKLALSIVLPEGVDPEAIRWQQGHPPYTWKGYRPDRGDRPAVAWVQDVRFTEPHMFGVSFPKKHVSGIQRMTLWKLFIRWWLGDPGARMWAALAFFLVFGLFFFLMTRFTGWSLFLVILGVASYVFYKHPLVQLGLWLFIPFWIWLWYRGSHGPRPKYFRANLCVENGQIKRGLTAVEAAVLLELPLKKVVSMVFFGMLKKGVLKTVAREPFTVDINGERTKPLTVTRPDGFPVGVHAYEGRFMDALKKRPAKVADADFKDAIKSLIGSVKKKMRGFDLDRTREYYRRIVGRAWSQAKSAVDLGKREELVNHNLGWMLMEERFGSRWEEVETGGWRYRPRWFYGHHAPASAGGAVPLSPAPAPAAPSDVGLSDVTHSFASRMESVGDSLASPVDSFMSSIGAPKTTHVDLSAFDKLTMDAIESMASGSGGGGGGGCACAGCACACACAGGGR